MKEVELDTTTIRQYLLGGLDAGTREQVEQRLMTDRDYKEEVLIVEEELLEDYVSGALDHHERDLFLKNYLTTPLQKQKLRIAQALDKRATQNAPRTAGISGSSNVITRLAGVFRTRKLFLQLSWAALIVIFLGGTFLVFRIWRSAHELQAELARLNGSGSYLLEPGPTVSQLSLSPLTLRDPGNLPTITITKETQVVQLRIPQAQSQPQTYQAILKNSDNKEVLSVSGLSVRSLDNSRMLVLHLPAVIFSTGDYLLTIRDQNSAEDVADYSFRVIRQ
jgi:anti-sigma-K factor RskA